MKNLNFLLLASASVVILSGCGSDSTPEGSVKDEKSAKESKIIGAYTCSDSPALKSIELRKSGKAYFKLELFGSASEMAGSYEVDIDKLIVDTGDGKKLLFSISNNRLNINQADINAECVRDLNEEEKKLLAKQSKIIGKWHSKEGNMLIIEFKSDGKLVQRVDDKNHTGEWILEKKNKLSMAFDEEPEGNSEEFEFTFISDDEVELINERGSVIDTLARIE